MKIGIITQPLRLNYGGLLQNYALQTVLKRMGHDPVTLDSPYELTLPVLKRYYILLRRLIRKYLRDKEQKIFIERNYNKKYKILGTNTREFTEKYINRQEVKDLSELTQSDFRALIAGSDQVWCPKYNQKIENSFLEFASGWNVRRIAYAASFGTSDWEYTLTQQQICTALIKHFDAVSVREKSGVILCSKYLDTNAQHVLDPTMLLSKEDYTALVKEARTEPSKGDLFCYILDQNSMIKEFTENVSQKLNLSPFSISIENFRAPLNELKPQPKVEQWLRSFIDAKLVITDSFHACVFSIIFNKPFLIIGNEVRGMARFESLLKTFDLEKRLISYKELKHFNIDSIKRCLAVNQDTNSILEGLRKDSLAFLSNNLN